MSPGFPDWQEYAQWVADTITITDTTINGGRAQTPILVGQWGWVEIDYPGCLQDTMLEFAWRDTPTGNDINEEQWHIHNGSQSRIRIPVQAKYLKITVWAVVAGADITLYVTPVNAPLDRQRAPLEAILGGNNGETVNAGVTANHYLVPYRGNAYLNVTDPATASQINVIAQDYTGANLGRLASATNPAEFRLNLIIPSAMILLQLINNDGVNRVFRWIVTAEQ